MKNRTRGAVMVGVRPRRFANAQNWLPPQQPFRWMPYTSLGEATRAAKRLEGGTRQVVVSLPAGMARMLGSKLGAVADEHGVLSLGIA